MSEGGGGKRVKGKRWGRLRTRNSGADANGVVGVRFGAAADGWPAAAPLGLRLRHGAIARVSRLRFAVGAVPHGAHQPVPEP